jgi:hypothetical protein
MMKNTFALAGTAATLFAGVSAQDAQPDCDAETMACAVDTDCAALLQADPPDVAATMANTLGAAMYTCMFSGQECGAETLACFGDAACAAIMAPADGSDPDMGALMGNTLGNAYVMCHAGDRPCVAEMGACTGDSVCMAAMQAEDAPAA